MSLFSRKNFVLSLMIIGILISSVIFYEYQKTDYENERELNEIAKIISKQQVSGLNFHPSETRYIRAAELPDKWPFVFFDKMHKIKTIPTDNYFDLKSFISNSQADLTHIMVDDDHRLPQFLRDVYYDDKNYEYLVKVFDSKDYGFKHQVKVFKIDFQKFHSTNN